MLFYTRYVLLFILLLQLSGCVFRDLKNDIKRLEDTGEITGTLSNQIVSDAPMVAQLLRVDGAQISLAGYSLHRADGPFIFKASSGKYKLLIFSDENKDLIYQDNELAMFAISQDIDVSINTHIDLGNIVLSNATIMHPPSQQFTNIKNSTVLDKVSHGKVVTMTYSGFSREQANLALWQPVEFLLGNGGGLFFLEEYNPNKTPLLFIHGLGGNPSDWQFILDNIDLTNYQVWLYQYPTGLSMSDNVELLRRTLSETQLKLTGKPKKITVIAHSLGGLLSRGLFSAIDNKNTFKTDDIFNRFISLSTPWNGQKTAETGVKQAPAVIPSWRDLVPNSEFQQTIFKNPLAKNLQHHLLFGFKDERSLFSNDASDGVVTVQSQLFQQAQREATKIYGLDLSHVGILNSLETIALLNNILNKKLISSNP